MLLLRLSISFFLLATSFSRELSLSEDVFSCFSNSEILFFDCFSNSEILFFASFNSFSALVFPVFRFPSSLSESEVFFFAFSKSFSVEDNFLEISSNFFLASANSFLLLDKFCSRSVILDLKSNKTLPSTFRGFSGFSSALAQSILIISPLF
jgi:hypothetical protein